MTRNEQVKEWNHLRGLLKIEKCSNEKKNIFRACYI